LHTFAELRCIVTLPKEAWHAKDELRQKKNISKYIYGTNGLKLSSVRIHGMDKEKNYIYMNI